MTPFELGILIHYYGCADDHFAVKQNVPIWPETRDQFIADGLLEAKRTDYAMYRLGERGEAFVKALCDMPLPVKKWVMPESVEK